jgi:hypothetical protein
VVADRRAHRRRKQRRADLQEQIAQCQALAQVATLRESQALREVAAHLIDWQGLLTRQPAQGRQILKKLLQGGMVFEAFEDAHGRGYKIHGQASYGRLVAGVIPSVETVGAGVPGVLEGRNIVGSVGKTLLVPPG